MSEPPEFLRRRQPEYRRRKEDTSDAELLVKAAKLLAVLEARILALETIIQHAPHDRGCAAVGSNLATLHPCNCWKESIR